MPTLVAANTHPQTRYGVNESVVRLVLLHGEHHWRPRELDDEFFFVVSGCFLIDRTVELVSGQGFVVLKGCAIARTHQRRLWC